MPTFTRNASAKWNGTGKEGKGWVAGESKALDTQYNWNNRFGEGSGTNPEELVAAAHAACFTMKLAFVLDGMGATAEELNTTSKVTTDKAPGDWTITKIHIVTTGKVPGIDQAKFQEAAENAKANCPISRALKAEMTVDAKLV
ncbi:MAG: OsmC family peroxiredoxin [Bacteroidota bacterium]|nr:OsmC family peroxiredoxin [Bacteroidota bacterium]MDP4237503.1 OsmC family peroxiredoxin [Bacteroidota bacterium]